MAPKEITRCMSRCFDDRGFGAGGLLMLPAVRRVGFIAGEMVVQRAWSPGPCGTGGESVIPERAGES